MHSLAVDIERVKRKMSWKNNKLTFTVDGLLEQLDYVLEELDESQHSKELKRNVENHKIDKEETELIINMSVQKILGRKHIKTIQNIHKEFYPFLSKLGKSVDKIVTDNAAKLQKVNFGLGKRSLEDLINSKSVESEKLLMKKLSKKETTLDSFKQAVDCQNYEKAFSIISKKSKGSILDKEEEELYYSSLKTRFVELTIHTSIHDACEFLKDNFNSEDMSRMKEIGEMLHFITVKHSESIPRRLMQFTFENLDYQTKLLAHKAVRISKGLPQNSLIRQIISAGLLTYRMIEECYPQTTQNNIELTGNIDLPNWMTHHSTVYCPVSREVCLGHENKPLLQNCGHIVGESSTKKMLEATHHGRENTGQIKCPTCPNQQKPSSMRPISY